MPDGPFLHAQAIVEPGAEVGARTRVWAFAHLLPGAHVGEDCNICDHVFTEGGVRLGNRVTAKCGVQLWSGVTLEDDVLYVLPDEDLAACDSRAEPPGNPKAEGRGPGL